MKLSDNKHHVPPTTCPYCGKELDGASGVDYDGGPEPGAWGVCLYCAGLVVYNDELQQVEPDAATLAEMVSDPNVMRLQRAVQQLQRKSPPP